uniref:Retrotransposon gag domain-containing protein n=1 Tax=Lactuca sativa TaxID=4236 RepID=A0A9R1XLN1_LACSA|nr:hypothetical protein LSAT_V11C300143420 [Lactuca sativa]
MEREIRTSVRYANTSSEIWCDLEERFEKEGAPRAYELKQSLNALRQGGASVSTYYTKLRTAWDELQTVLPNPRCTCEGCHCGIGKQLNEVKEKERSYEFLMGLDDDFSVVRTQILAMKPTPSLSTIYHLVAESNSKRTRVEAAAFQADYNGQRSSRQTPAKTNSTSVNKVIQKIHKAENERKEKCSHCQCEGHSKEGCFKLIGYPDWWPDNKEKAKPKAACVELETSPVPGLTDKQYRLFVAHFQENGNLTGNKSHPRANMAGRNQSYNGWVVDSGATEHMTCRDDFLENKNPSPKETPVVIPNGDMVPVTGEGEHTLNGGVKLKGVLLVPNFDYNLLSVGKLTDELNCVVSFFPGFVVMQELGTKHLIGAGDRVGGLYRMGSTKPSKALLTTFETKTDVMLVLKLNTHASLFPLVK